MLNEDVNIMKYRITAIAAFLIFVCTTPLFAQSGKELKAIRKEEKRDLDSLFLVYSLPVYITVSKNFTEIGIEDSLIALLRERKYKRINNSDFEQLFKIKFAEIMPKTDPASIKETIKNRERDKDYFLNLIASADPFAQQIKLSFLKRDSGINCINIKRFNLPDTRKSREWILTYADSETHGQFASRILDLLIRTRRAD